MVPLSWRPDIVVGIDFGMTCTGVAYSMGPEWPEPKTIQHWPGRLGHELRNKVDTAVSYDMKTGGINRWGFLCDPQDESSEFNELFKLYLDPKYQDPSGIAPSIEQAQGWFRDYLHCLQKFIHKFFSESVPRFQTKSIEYVFSVPTTWKDPALIAAMERLIKDAGFGQKQKERASISLTEAEAAAVYATQRLEKDEVFLVCDAGGGTTDLNVLKVSSNVNNKLELTPLSWTEGIAVGSTLIDYKARMVLMEKLRPIRDWIPGDLETVVAKMVDDQFRTFKCSFGVEGFFVPKLFLPIPGLSPGKDFLEAGVEGSKVVMTREELKDIFDEQIEKMFALIDNQLQIVMNSHSREEISYLVFSGGLSSSPYVQQRARKRYENGGNLRLSNSRNLKVLVASEPQLAVVHGLVIARTQTSRGGAEIYGQRRCPVSYGVLCREIYDPLKHQGDDVSVDPYDKTTWATGQIAWLVKKGDVVDADEGIKQRYRRKLDLLKEDDPQKTGIYMSDLPPHQLPHSLRAGFGTVEKVCSIEFQVDRNDMKLKNRHWYNMKPKYYRAEYEVRAIVGAGLKFQIWGRTGLMSKDHEEIEVQWQAVGKDMVLPAKRAIQDTDAMYRF